MLLKRRENIILGLICAAVCVVLLIVGLWPFSFWPENEVSWLPDNNGIRFYGRGIAYSNEPVSLQNRFISIEIYLQPATDSERYAKELLSIYDGNDTAYFTLLQWESSLVVLRRRIINKEKIETLPMIGIDNALVKGEKKVITITSGAEGTAIYIDGKFSQFSKNFKLINPDAKMAGQLVLGNSASGRQPWVGNIFGLSIYERLLNKDEVFQNYTDWSGGGSPLVANNKNLIARYLFDEHSGTSIKNRARKQHNLLVPRTLQILRKDILVPDLRFSLSYLVDVLLNIAGFMPFGFILSVCCYKLKQYSMIRIYLMTMVLGGGVSFAIEVIQASLPTRSSSLTDLICNIFGTILGSIVFQLVSRNPRFCYRNSS